MSITYLKIKIMSLAAEAKIIRKEQRNWPKSSDNWQGLRAHRVWDVRNESRAALLAYGFLRGTPFADIESGAKQVPFARVLTLVRKYGQDPKLPEQALHDWFKF